MKRLVAGVAGLCLFGLVVVAWAGDYHYGTTLICSDCHVMHFSQTHGYNNDGGGGIDPPLGTQPEPFLLRDEVNKLCLSCHDGEASTPDVYGNNTLVNTRQAGALNKTTDGGPYYPANGHTLYSKAIAPGGTWAPDTSEGLNCVNCHHQHGFPGGGFSDPGGTGTYRNLMARPGNAPTNRWITYRVGVNDLTKDVFERATGGVATHYAVSNIDFNEPDQTKSAYGAWCQGCHTNFHGSSADANMRDAGHAAGTGWLRHPTADANIGALTGGHSSLAVLDSNLYRTQVMSASGNWGTQGSTWPGSPTDLTPSCFSCHKGHGNKNAFGLIYALGNAPLGEEGDGTQAKNLCKQCHVQGAD